MNAIAMKLEVIPIPVSDVDRAKRFYSDLGWRLDGDFTVGDEFRGVQFTPPGSHCSIHFGKGVTDATPGAARYDWPRWYAEYIVREHAGKPLPR
ncbi:MAG TPA: VOC family protein [Steroidobacteraceae bacterium]